MARQQETFERENPHRPGELVEFRRISWSQEEQARRRQAKDARDEAKAWGVEWAQALNSKEPGAEDRARKMLQERKWSPDSFDTETLLSAGVVAIDGEKPNKETLAELDAPTARWCKEQVIELIRPRSEEEGKNSSGGSIDT